MVFKKLKLFSIIMVLITMTMIPVSGKGLAVQSENKGQTKVTLSNAQFHGLTQIVVDTGIELKGVSKQHIMITVKSYTVPENLITEVKAEGNKLTVNLDPAAFSKTSSVGATISTKAFGDFGSGAAVPISLSGDPLTGKVWDKISSNNSSSGSVWHNISSQTTLHIDPTAYTPPAGATQSTPFYKQIGKLKGLMVVVDFPDAKAADNTGVNGSPGETPEDYGNRIHGHVLKTADDYYDWFVPRAHEFFNTSSYGQLDLDVTLAKNPNSKDGVFTAKKTLYGDGAADKGYAFDRGGDINTYLQDVLSVAKPNLKDFPGGPYDILYVVAVENASGISYGPTDTWGGPANSLTGRTDFKGLVRIGFDSYSRWRTKAFNHETGHNLGLADYYINGFSGYGGGQTDPITGTADYYPIVGHWDSMGYINGPAPDYFAWFKWKLGWIRDDQVDIITSQGTTEHQLTSVETPGGTKLVAIPGPSAGVVYLIEYRQAAGVDNTGVREVSTDPDPNHPNENWTHAYGTFQHPGILMYKIDASVPTLSGPLVVTEIHPDQTTKELGTSLDSSVLGDSTGIYSYTDEAAGVTVKVTKETPAVASIKVSNNPPNNPVKPKLSEVKFIDPNTVEFKTSHDLRGIYKDKIVLKKKNGEKVTGVKINQITPRTMRVTFDSGQFPDADATDGASLELKAFSFFGSSDPVPVTPLTTLAPPRLDKAKFKNLTTIQVKSDVDLTGITAQNLVIKKVDGSTVSANKITDVDFANKVLTIKLNADQFPSAMATAGTTIATKLFSNYLPSALDLQMAKFNPPVKVYEPSGAVEIIDLLSAAEIKKLVERFEEEGEFANHGASRSLQAHLISVDHFEKKKAAKKVVKHMKGFNLLLNHQKDHKLISKKAYNILKANADSLIKKWH